MDHGIRSSLAVALVFMLAACGGGGGGVAPESGGSPGGASNGGGGGNPAFVPWARGAGGLGVDEARDVVALPDGGCIITGQFSDVAVFGAGEANETTLTSAGQSDIFVARYSAAGDLVWATSAGGTDPDRGYDLAALPDGSCVVTGKFGGTALFGAGEANQTSLTSAGSGDLFVARFDPAGDLVWTRRDGGADDDTGRTIGALADGSCVVAGVFQGDPVFGQGEANEDQLMGPGSSDIFLARYASDGSFQQVRWAGGSAFDAGHELAILPDGGCLLTGTFSDGAVFGAGEANETTLTTAGSRDSFVARWNPGGDLAWVRQSGGALFDTGTGIDSLADGSSVVSGVFQGSAVFGPGEANETTLNSAGAQDLYVAAYGADGSLSWVRSAQSASTVSGNSIAIFPDGSCIVAGHIQGTTVLGAGEPNETTLDPIGTTDILVAYYAADGSLGWARQDGGSGEEYANGVSTRLDGSFVVTGGFVGTAVFGPGDPLETTLLPIGLGGVFVVNHYQGGGL